MTKDYVINPDRFQNFFNHLETRRTLITTVTDLNTRLLNHFISLEQTLTKKSLTLDIQIEKFKNTTEKTVESLRVRENLLPEKEVTLAGRVKELEESAINDITKGSNLCAKKKTMLDLLVMWFRRMDCEGLMAFLLENRTAVALREEAVVAAAEAVDLLGLVLEAVEGLMEMKFSGKKVEGMAPTRCASGILIEAAFPISGGGSCGGGDGMARSLKERAGKVLEKWKGVLGGEGGGVSSGEAIMFLQMVIGFGLRERFEEQFLKDLVLKVSCRRDMAKLVVVLGLGEKTRDIVEELVKTGKEIEAVYIASEAGLTELFPPVTLIKSSLRNCQKTADNKTSKNTPSLEDINNELNITRAIIKCVEDYNLESEFTINNLKKRVDQLEKAKSDKKSCAASRKKPFNKWPHGGKGRAATSSSSFRPPKSNRFSNTSPAFRRRNRHPPPTHQPSATRLSAPSPYSYSSVYENNLTTTSYGAGHSRAHMQNPVAYRLQYANPSPDIGAGRIQAGQSNYGGAYDYSAPAAPSADTYMGT